MFGSPHKDVHQWIELLETANNSILSPQSNQTIASMIKHRLMKETIVYNIARKLFNVLSVDLNSFSFKPADFKL